MAQVSTTEQTKVKLSEPPRYVVVMHNDDYTPMDFVIEILVTIFNHTVEEAKQLTLEIHNEGKAVCGEYYYELAEQKSTESIALARSNGHPLQVEVDRA
jgi:ATP-dependent Clp protease adaptor protein ClpS